ncbi:hypothetical protein [Streptomyces sp. NPDC005131]
MHHAVTYAVEGTHGQPELPVQNSPWQPHVAAIYSEESWLLDVLVERLGPLTFDRIRVAFAGDHTDIPLGTQEEPMAEKTAAGLPARPWSTPDDCAIAFENQQTGDGRTFSAGALYWSGRGTWPLQYADEMLMGHQGAELASAIQEPLAAAVAAPVAAATSDTHQRVVAYVSSSPVAVGAREVATAVEVSMSTARGHLVRAAEAGRLIRLAPGLYVGTSTLPEGEAVASADAAQDDDSDELVASAWTALRETDPMPAAWFQEPTEDELPPGSGGVHYSGGRVYGWVAHGR